MQERPSQCNNNFGQLFDDPGCDASTTKRVPIIISTPSKIEQRLHGVVSTEIENNILTESEQKIHSSSKRFHQKSTFYLGARHIFCNENCRTTRTRMFTYSHHSTTNGSKFSDCLLHPTMYIARKYLKTGCNDKINVLQ